MRTIYGESGGIMNTAGKLYELYGEIISAKNQLEKCKTDLPSFWQGDDAKSFEKNLDSCIASLKKFEKTADNYCNYLNLVAKTFDAIEESYNRTINVPKG